MNLPTKPINQYSLQSLELWLTDLGALKDFNNIGKEIKSLAMEQGLFIRPLGNVIYLLPPLCITDDQLEKSYWIIRQILENL